MMSIFRAVTLAAGFCVVSAPVAAQEQIPVEIDTDWQHTQTTLRLPLTLAGFTRTEVSQYDKEQFNVAVTLDDNASKTSATLYIYRTGVVDLPIWADRAATTMLSGNRFGSFDLENVEFGSFTPPNGSGADSGFRLVVPLSGSSFTSTGLLLFLHEGWLVKLRMSSQQLSASELDRRMADLVAAIPLDQANSTVPAFAAIEDCAARLNFEKDAKLVKLDMMSVIILGGALGAARKNQGSPSSEPVRWCRDKLGERFAVYRADGSEKSYTVAFSDAGITASVDRYDMSGLMNPSRGYLVTVSNGVTEEILTPFNRLPKPEQVVGIVGRVGPMTTVDVRPGSTGEQTIYVSTE